MSVGKLSHQNLTGIVTEDYRYYFKAGGVAKGFLLSYTRLFAFADFHYKIENTRMGFECATNITVTQLVDIGMR